MIGDIFIFEFIIDDKIRLFPYIKNLNTLFLFYVEAFESVG